MLKCSTSLWSADLANLESEIKRVEPFSERFHLDVADGHYTPTMLFFPDLVQAIRPHTSVPFEVHLLTTDPVQWIEPFAEAGVNGFIFCYDTVQDFGKLRDLTRMHNCMMGISLALSEPVQLLDPFWKDLDLVTIIGTEIGIKGVGLDERAPKKLREAKQRIEESGAATETQSDGGIRRHTVPQLKEAGADWIVPGSLMFKENPSEMREWLAGL